MFWKEVGSSWETPRKSREARGPIGQVLNYRNGPSLVTNEAVLNKGRQLVHLVSSVFSTQYRPGFHSQPYLKILGDDPGTTLPLSLLPFLLPSRKK